VPAAGSGDRRGLPRPRAGPAGSRPPGLVGRPRGGTSLGQSTDSRLTDAAPAEALAP